MLAPDIPTRPAAWCRLAKDEPALVEVIGRHFDMNAIAKHGADAVTPHPSGSVGDDAVIIVQQDAKAPVGQDLFDQAFERQQIFLGHLSVLQVDRRWLAAIVGLDFIADALVLLQCPQAGTLDTFAMISSASCTKMSNILVAPEVVWK